MKLIDCFLYFDEDTLLDIRLNILDKIVHKFIISEATRDHSGKKRKLKFDIKKFAKFKKKIIYIVEENLPEKVNKFKKNWSNDWHRENMHRNSLELGYANYGGDDLIMISDLDEIPDPKRIKEFNPKNKYGCFLQKNLYTKINLLNATISEWSGTKICVKKYLKSPQWLRNIKTKKRPVWKFYKPQQPQLIPNGGWHFSFLKSPVNIIKKINAYAHQEYNIKKFTNINYVKKMIENKTDLFDRNYQYKKIDLNNKNYPKYILENQLKLKNWILK